MRYNFKIFGGFGSGHHGHRGLPGVHGGSTKGRGRARAQGDEGDPLRGPGVGKTKTLFHGTTFKRAKKIMGEGLRLRNRKRRGMQYDPTRTDWRETRVFTTTNKLLAAIYADSRSEHPGGKPAVVKIVVPHDEFMREAENAPGEVPELMADDEPRLRHEETYTFKRIDKKWITKLITKLENAKVLYLPIDEKFVPEGIEVE